MIAFSINELMKASWLDIRLKQKICCLGVYHMLEKTEMHVMLVVVIRHFTVS